MPDLPVSIVLVGIGGMGAVYVDALLGAEEKEAFEIRAAVDPSPQRCPRLDDLRAAGVRISLEPGSSGGWGADLTVISSPHHFHASQTIAALNSGSRVLCEKPAAATIQDARAMIEAERRSGRWVAIGYQWSFSEAIQRLKADILDGAFGRPRRLKCLNAWPRDRAYYGRNDWAGRKRTADGAWVLDGPANNAMAHDLQAMLYLLGPDIRSCGRPVEVQAELYRANPIENYDTAAARFVLDSGAEVLLFVTHAGRRDFGPILDYEFELGTVSAAGRGVELRAEFAAGGVHSYGSPDATPMKKLWDSIRAVRTGELPVCGTDAAMGQTLAVNGMQDSCPDVVDFPAERKRREKNGSAERIWVEGLDQSLERCFEDDRLPSEIGFDWARPGLRVDLRDYPAYPRRRI